MSLLSSSELKKFFSSYFCKSKDSAFLVEENGCFINTSPGFNRLLGYDEGELTGRYFTDILDKDKTPGSYTSNVKAHYFHRSRETPIDIVLFDKQGVAVPVRLHSSFIKDESGQVIEIFGTVEDVRSSEQVEQERLWENVRKLKSILANSPDGFIVQNANGYVTLANKAFCTMLGYEEEDLLKKHAFDLTPFEGSYQATTGEILDLREDHIHRQIENANELLEKGSVSCRLYYVRKDKKIVPVEATYTVLFDNNGVRSGSFGIVRNIAEKIEADRQIERSRDSLEKIFKTIGDGLLVTDFQGHIIRANTAVCELLGYSEEELRGKHPIDFLPDGYSPTPLIGKLLTNGHVENYETQWLRKDGTIVPTESNITTIQDSQGNITGAISAVRDISKHKQAEDALRSSEERFRTITQTTFDAIMSINSQGKIVFWNNGAKRIFGYEEYEALGMTVQNLVAEKYRDRDREGMDRFFQTGVSEFIEKTTSYTCVKKDGTEFYGEIAVSSWEINGEVFCTATVRDVTDRKQAEQELRETKEYLDNIIKSSLDCIVTTDESGRITGSNPSFEKLTGYSQEELKGKIIADFAPSIDQVYECSTGTAVQVGKDYYETIVEKMKTLADSGAVSNLFSYYIRKDGRAVPVEQNIVALYEGQNNMAGSVGIIRDITDHILAEDELRNARDFLENVIKTTVDGILITDEQGVITRANNTVLSILGYTENELRGKHTSELVPPSLKDERNLSFITDIMKDLFEKGSVKSFETCWLKKDGSIFPIEINITLLRDREGNPTGSVSGIRDITERKKAEEELRESEERFRALAKSAPEAVIAVNNEGKIAFWNNGAKNIFGYNETEILGQSVSELVPERYREKDLKGFQGMQQHGTCSSLEKKVQGFGRRKDGSEFFDEISIGSWESKNGVYFVAIIRDVTERKEAEEALVESERRFKELADSLPQTVFELDQESNITFANRIALETFGYTQADLETGLNVLKIFMPEQRLRVRENFDKVLQGERLGDHEYTALRKDGTTFPCIIHAVPIINENQAAGLRGILIDITERKALEDELLKTRRIESIAALAGGVSQDFNALLSTILGNVNIAQHYAMPGDKISEPLEIAERNTLRAKDLTDQLLLFSRGAETNIKTVYIGSLLHTAAESAHTNTEVEYNFNILEDLWPTDIDESQLLQVFINIITNADHAMPEGGIIHISALNAEVGPGDNLPLQNGKYVKIEIRDQSIGILNEHIQNIFDPYFTSRQRGSGIGLATTYTIIKNHNGLISVESEFGSGTTFFIYLPAAQPQNK